MAAKALWEMAVKALWEMAAVTMITYQQCLRARHFFGDFPSEIIFGLPGEPAPWGAVGCYVHYVHYVRYVSYVSVSLETSTEFTFKRKIRAVVGSCTTLRESISSHHLAALE